MVRTRSKGKTAEVLDCRRKPKLKEQKPKEEAEQMAELNPVVREQLFGEGFEADFDHYHNVREIEADHYQIPPNIITLIQQGSNFYGYDKEDPNVHIREFLMLCNVFKLQGITQDAVRRTLFPFTLKGKARDWFEAVDGHLFETFEEMTKRFVTKYFPPERVEQLRSQTNQRLEYLITLSETQQKFNNDMRRRMDDQDQKIRVVESGKKIMENQLGQIASDIQKLLQNSGGLPSNTVQNPKGKEQCNILRSGREIEGDAGQPQLEEGIQTEEKVQIEKEAEADREQQIQEVDEVKECVLEVMKEEIESETDLIEFEGFFFESETDIAELEKLLAIDSNQKDSPVKRETDSIGSVEIENSTDSEGFDSKCSEKKLSMGSKIEEPAAVDSMQDLQLKIPILREGIQLKPAIEEPQKLELNLLSESLKNAIPGENQNFTVIISFRLNGEKERKLLEALREGRTALADIKGFSPTTRLHGKHWKWNLLQLLKIECFMKIFIKDYSIFRLILYD